MTKLSSNATGFYKKGFPTLWFGLLGLTVVTLLAQGAFKKAGAMVLVVPCGMTVLGYFMLRKFLSNLADEVFDGGDHLVIKNRGREYRVALADIMNVSATVAVNPPRITLRLDGIAAAGE